MEIAPLASLLVALILLFEHGISGQVHPSKKENVSSSKSIPSFRASQLSKPKTTILAKSKLTTKTSSRPITTTKRIGQTTKPIKNQQFQKQTTKLKPQPRQLPKKSDWGPVSVSLHPAPAEGNKDYGNLTSTELPDIYDDLTTSTTLNTTEVPNTSTVEDVTRKRLKRRKTTTSDPTTSTKRRLKRTRTTTVGPEDA